jgi:hypothetical protein
LQADVQNHVKFVVASTAPAYFPPAMKIKRLPAGFVVPVQPVKASKPPVGTDWVHEIKHDGYRIIVRRDGCKVRLYTRNAYDWAVRLATIATAAKLVKAKSFTIDREAVAPGPGLSRFEELSRREAARTAILYAFDLIEHDGEAGSSCPSPTTASSSSTAATSTGGTTSTIATPGTARTTSATSTTNSNGNDGTTTSGTPTTTGPATTAGSGKRDWHDDRGVDHRHDNIHAADLIGAHTCRFGNPGAAVRGREVRNRDLLEPIRRRGGCRGCRAQPGAQFDRQHRTQHGVRGSCRQHERRDHDPIERPALGPATSRS